MCYICKITWNKTTFVKENLQNVSKYDSIRNMHIKWVTLVYYGLMPHYCNYILTLILFCASSEVLHRLLWWHKLLLKGKGKSNVVSAWWDVKTCKRKQTRVREKIIRLEKRKSKETQQKETSRECAHIETYMVGTAYLKEGVSIIR